MRLRQMPPRPHQLAELLHLHEHMLTRRLLRPLRRAGGNRVGDRPVLRERPPHPVRHPQLKPPVRLEGPLERVGLLAQILVAAGVVDDRVEAGVGVVVGIGVARARMLLALPQRVLELGERLTLYAASRKPRRHPLQLRHDLEALGQLGHAQLGDVRPLLRADLYEAGPLEGLQRLAHRRARAAELALKLRRVEAFARPVPAVHHRVLQGVAHASGLRDSSHLHLRLPRLSARSRGWRRSLL